MTQYDHIIAILVHQKQMYDHVEFLPSAVEV